MSNFVPGVVWGKEEVVRVIAFLIFKARLNAQTDENVNNGSVSPSTAV